MPFSETRPWVEEYSVFTGSSHVTIAGRVVGAPRVGVAKNGRKYCSFSLKTERHNPDLKNALIHESWLVVVFGWYAPKCASSLVPHSEVVVVGSMEKIVKKIACNGKDIFYEKPIIRARMVAASLTSPAQDVTINAARKDKAMPPLPEQT